MNECGKIIFLWCSCSALIWLPTKNLVLYFFCVCVWTLLLCSGKCLLVTDYCIWLNLPIITCRTASYSCAVFILCTVSAILRFARSSECNLLPLITHTCNVSEGIVELGDHFVFRYFLPKAFLFAFFGKNKSLRSNSKWLKTVYT